MDSGCTRRGERLVFMNCPSCGEVCTCQSGPPARSVAAEERVLQDERQGGDLDDAAWRDELSARLHRYRARRKMRPPRYPSLSLQFDAVASPSSLPGGDGPEFRVLSDRALALDGMMAAPVAGDSSAREAEMPAPQTPILELGAPRATGPRAEFLGAKIIEFPRYAWAPPPPPPDQLAEPVMDKPRILEVPEVAPPPPALGGITIEGAERQDAERRPGIDFPLRSASLARRLLANAIDGLIVVGASALFGGVFWKVAAARPPLAQVVALAVAIPCLFWIAFQYLLIVYAASTPGLRAAGLKLARFDGTATGRSLRRWRVLASYLSAASLGMGYAWTFLDEDALCWHDRITHTYLAPKSRDTQ